MIRWLLAAVAAVGLAVAGSAAFTQERDVAYGEGDPRQVLDVYLPEACPEAGCPAVVFIHGGGWTRGDKRGYGAVANAYTARGAAFIAANYRLAPAHTHPALIEDVAAAVAWTFENAGALGVDRARIGVMGHSAGAHLAALAASDPQWLAAHGLAPSDLALAAPIDTAAYDLQAAGRVAKRGLRQAFGRDESAWSAVSPQARLAGDHALPPFLIAYATRRADATAASATFAEAVRARGGVAELLGVDDVDHRAIMRNQADPDFVVVEAIVSRL